MGLERLDNSSYNRRYREKDYRYSGVAGVVSGVLAMIAGVVGLQSFKNPKSYFKSGVNLGFCIVACIAGVTSLGIYAAGVG